MRWVRSHSKKLYETLGSILRFRDEQNTRRVQKKRRDAKKLPMYAPGVMDDVLQNHAVPWFGHHFIASCGDGTRVERQVGRQGIHIVGHHLHPDVSEWGKQEFMVPRTASELHQMIMLIRKLGMLGSEAYTEHLRCISDPLLPALTYALYPEAPAGKSGFFTFKYWMKIIGVLHSTQLRLTTFITDHCSVGIGAGKIMNTPTDEMLALGCSYLGLPVDDYKYYMCYCRPRLGGWLPPPITFVPDFRHWIRLVRRNLDGLGFLVFFNEKIGTIQGSQVASMHELLELSRHRNDHGVPLRSIVLINKYADFKDDAALHMVAAQTIALLPEHDKATRLALVASHHLAQVFTLKDFTNPVLAVEYAWRCFGIWDTQRRYITKVVNVERPSDCLPSYQFTTSVEMMACYVTNHFLMFYLHHKEAGLDWGSSALCAVNNDMLEGLHGEGRTMTNASSFTFESWLRNQGIIVERKVCEAVLTAAGVEVGQARHKAKTLSGKIDLGVLPCNKIGHDRSFTAWPIPETYADFVEEIIAARERGLHWARELYVETFGQLCLEQFQKAEQWEVRERVPPNMTHASSTPMGCQMLAHDDTAPTMPTDQLTTQMMRVRDKAIIPDQMALLPKHGTIPELLSLVRCPAAPIDVDTLVQPKSVAKAVEKLQADAAKLNQQLRGDLDLIQAAVEGGQATTATAQLQALVASAKAYRDELQQREDDTKAKKQAEPRVTNILRPTKRHKFLAATDTGSVDHASILNGSIIWDESTQEWVSTDQLMNATQRKDKHSRDRAKAFIVYRLKDYTVALRDGHDITIGSMMAIKWGGPGFFAVVRVTKLFEGSQQTYSIKLNKKSAEHSIRVELMVPVLSAGHIGDANADEKPPAVGVLVEVHWPKDKKWYPGKVSELDGEDNMLCYVKYDDGDESWEDFNEMEWRSIQNEEELPPPSCDVYRASGWQLGPVSGRSVIALLEMVDTSNLEHIPIQHKRYYAVLPLADLVQLKSEGYSQVMLSKHGHVASFVSAMDAEAEPIEGWDPYQRCYRCKTCWFDQEKGVLVKCTGCHRSYHQECAEPRILTSNVTKWQCPVCSGADTLLCQLCGDNFTEHEVLNPDSLQNNELVQCAKCSLWWHQACHPGLYPLPVGNFVCNGCKPSTKVPPKRTATPRTATPRAAQAGGVEEASPATAPAARAEVAAPIPDPQIGSRINVYWDEQKRHYAGVVKEYNHEHNEHCVLYDDGDADWERLDLTPWQLLSIRTNHLVVHGKRTSTREERLTW